MISVELQAPVEGWAALPPSTIPLPRRPPQIPHRAEAGADARRAPVLVQHLLAHAAARCIVLGDHIIRPSVSSLKASSNLWQALKLFTLRAYTHAWPSGAERLSFSAKLRLLGEGVGGMIASPTQVLRTYG